MLVWERVERDHPVPVSQESIHSRLVRFSVRADERVAAPLTVSLSLGVWHRLEPLGRLLLLFRGQRVQDVGDRVVPASLLLVGRVDLATGRPDAEVPIRHGQRRELEPTGP